MGGIFIKKVVLTMNEEKKYETIKALVDHPNTNKLRAAVELGCTLRTINRMILRYKRYGKTGFIHGNRGRKPVSTIPDAIRSAVVMLYLNKYLLRCKFYTLYRASLQT